MATEAVIYGGNPSWLDVGFAADVTVSHVTALTGYIVVARVDLLTPPVTCSPPPTTWSLITTPSTSILSATGVRSVRITALSDGVSAAILRRERGRQRRAGTRRRASGYRVHEFGCGHGDGQRHTGADVTAGAVELFNNTIDVSGQLTAGRYSFTGIQPPRRSGATAYNNFGASPT